MGAQKDSSSVRSFLTIYKINDYMKHRTILLGAFFFPVLLQAQTEKQEEKADSIVEADRSLVGVIDVSDMTGGDDDDGNMSQDINTTVLTSHDIYLNNVSYQLSPMRFRVRGYENIYEQKYINGVPLNDQFRGVFNYSSIGAINDLTRSGDEANYSVPGAFTFGSIGNSENILMKAGDFAKGGKVTMTYTNRIYWLRAMASYSTGLSKRGWALTALVGGRYSNEGVVEGTFYHNLSYALLLEKRWNGGEHSLSLATFGSPVERGQQGPALNEVYELRGDNQYNPNWGFQYGEKRNARIVNAFDPTTILSYTWNISPKVKFDAGLSFHYGRYGGSALNWYDGADPRPDYYRNLPSYLSANGSTALAEDYTRRWIEGDPRLTQINWDRLYEANYLNKRTGDGSAIYMVEERRSDLYETTFNATLNAELNRYNKLTGGLTARNTISRQFKTVKDLMGADYVWDIDKFAEQDFHGDANKKQNDLNRPNRKVFKNGIFGYDYDINVNSVAGWLINNYRSAHWDGYYGFKVTYTDFWRDGKMKNGHFPDNSFGNGAHHKFTDVMLKSGLSYKFNGRHLLTGNLTYGSQAPLPYDAYISPRVYDRTPNDLKSGRIFAADLNYIFSLPRLQGRVSVFQTNFYDQMERTSYYDDYQKTFVNHVLSNVQKIHRGVEAAATYKLDDHWSFDLAGTVAQYYYANNPLGTTNSENGKILDQTEKIYMNGLYVGGVPQFAGTFGIRYFVNYWFFEANLNGFGKNHVEVAPSRHAASTYATINPKDPAQWNAYQTLTHQEEFGNGYTIDLSIGKIIYIGKKQSINFNLSVNNLTNRKDIRTGGFEQGRISTSKPDLYKSKYYYMQGINCFMNVSYRF